MINLPRICILSLLFCAATTRAFYTKYDKVQELTPENFKNQVLKSSGVWIVEFYAPWCGHCQNLAPEWKKAAKTLDGIVNVAAVDADKYKELAAQYGIRGFPSIKIFGENKNAPQDYQGPRQSKAIVDAAFKEARSVVKKRLNGSSKKSKPSSTTNEKKRRKPSKKSTNPVIQLDETNFHDQVYGSGDVWLVEFFAPWCGHCKALAPEWEQAASELKGSVKVAAVDATANERLAGEFGIRGYPTIKVFGPTAQSASDAEDYQGQRTADAIVSFGLNKLDQLGGGLKIKEITSTSTFEDHCSGKSICVLSFLPNLIDSHKSGREEYLKTLEDAAKQVRGKPFRFGWVQGGDQLDVENKFGLTFGYPSVLAINLDKQRYVVQRGAFGADAIAEFLQGVLSGKEATSKFDAVPEFTTVAGWDGKDVSTEEILDNEEDDDILDEILGSSTTKDEL